MAAYMRLSYLSFLLFGASVAQIQSPPWPYNLPPHVKYYPEEEVLVRRDIEISRRLAEQQPLFVRKMTGDPNEKFSLDFWCFEDDDPSRAGWNQTFFHKFGASLPLHSNVFADDSQRYARVPFIGPRSQNSKRDFGCPMDTSACTSINRSNTCCPNGSTCQIVSDTGLGDVGCCEASQTCAGSLAQCPQGYTSCPNNPGGGCCLPGYACFDEGCVMTSTTVVLVTPTTTTTTTTSTTTTTTTTSELTTTTPNVLSCSPSFRSCPASLGGGCCPTDRACGRDICPEMTTSASLTAPLRPTTASTISPATTSSFVSPVGCPTGFYACSAYHQGGCCQVGRDCASTSCPTTATATVINTNGITAVAPSGTYLANTPGSASSHCATGWSSCAADVGGGCCPTGYACGTAACSATASGASGTQVSKEAPQSAGSRSEISWTFMMTTIVLLYVINVVTY